MTEPKSAPLIPKLRFPEFEGSGPWVTKVLDTLCDRVSETVGDNQLTPVSISAGKGFVPQAEKFGRDISGAQYSKYIWLRHGEFAYNRGNSKRFPQGCVYQLTEFDEAAASNAFHCFRLHESLDPAFALGFFEDNGHGRQLIRCITSGARSNGLLNISADTFFGISIPVPPTTTEQQKIADCLTALDDLIAAEGKKLDTLRRYKQGLMQVLFPQEGERVPRIGSHVEWKYFNLPDKVFFQEGPGIMAADFCNKGVPLVRLSGLSNSVVTLDGCNHLNPDKVKDKWQHFLLMDGDLLISASASFGRSAIVTKVAAGSVFYTGLIRFRPLDSDLTTGFLWAFLNSPSFMRQALSFAVGGGIKHFGPSHLRQMKIPIPNTKEQRHVADIYSSLDNKLIHQSRKLNILKQYKQGLLQQLFPSLTEQES
jgi:type I restriction enzyme S subunit